MNKRELIDTVAEHTEHTKADVTTIVNAVIEAVQLAVARGDKVQIPGFGTFEAVFKDAYTGRNPGTGEPVQVPAKYTPKFTPGAGFKATVNTRQAVAA